MIGTPTLDLVVECLNRKFEVLTNTIPLLRYGTGWLHDYKFPANLDWGTVQGRFVVWCTCKETL